MKARDIMTINPISLSPRDTARDAALAMLENDCGCLPVTDSETGRLLGMITDRDLAVRGFAAGKGPDTPAAELMTRVVSARSPANHD